MFMSLRMQQQVRVLLFQTSLTWLLQLFINLCILFSLNPLSLSTTTNNVFFVQGSIYVNNVGYETLPAAFGKFMVDDRIYTARVQYLPSNPYLCEPLFSSTSEFHHSLGVTIPPDSNSDDDNNNNNNNNSIHIPGEPILLVVARGNCPFYLKAYYAEQIDTQIQFLAVYNTPPSETNGSGEEEEEEDDLVFMNSEYGYDTTRLVLISISHAVGQVLKHYIANQTYDVIESGGPMVELDALFPDRYQSVLDGGRYGESGVDLFELELVTTLGFFFLTLSFIGCMIIFVATHGQIRINTNGRVILVMSSSPNGNHNSATNTQRVFIDEDGNADNNNSPTMTTNNNNHGNATTPSVFSLFANRRLLTEEEVYHLHQQQLREQQHVLNETTEVGMMSGQNDSNRLDDDNCCAICLEEINDGNDIFTLPCQHKFHYNNCIVPWLTERQSKCPLCKYDVLRHVRDSHVVDSTTSTTTQMLELTSTTTQTPQSPRRNLGLHAWVLSDDEDSASSSSSSSSVANSVVDNTSTNRDPSHLNTAGTETVPATSLNTAALFTSVWNRLRRNQFVGGGWTPVVHTPADDMMNVSDRGGRGDNDTDHISIIQMRNESTTQEGLEMMESNTMMMSSTMNRSDSRVVLHNNIMESNHTNSRRTTDYSIRDNTRSIT